MPQSYKAEVIADNSGTWAGNALRFATQAEAESYVQNLSLRWSAVRETRVVPSDDPVTDIWDPDRGAINIERMS